MTEPLCDSCECKRLGLSLSTSLQFSTGHICSECLSNKPTCKSCNSSKVKVSADFGYDYISCYSCGYTVESIANLDKIPKRAPGVISEEAMAFYDAPENREVLIWVQNVKV